MEMLNIICVMKKSSTFSMEHFYRLKKALQKQIAHPHRIICLNNVYANKRKCDNVLYIPLANNYPSYWCKIDLFRPDIIKNFYPALFIDLDTAIVDDITSICLKGTNADFFMLSDFYRTHLPASGLMWLGKDAVDYNKIYTTFLKDEKKLMKQFAHRGDQAYISSIVTPTARFQDLFPDQILTFKPDMGKKRLKVIPENCRIVCFHGKPKPWDDDAFKEADWTEDYWADDENFKVYDKIHKGTLLIVGSGPCWKKDVSLIRKNRPHVKIMSIGHASGFIKSDFIYSDHYETHGKLKALQEAFHRDFTSHCYRARDWEKQSNVDYFWSVTRSKGSSVENSITVGLMMGFREIILCGCPLEKSKVQHPMQRIVDGNVFPKPNPARERTSDEELIHFKNCFIEHCEIYKHSGFVKSMSGFTKEILGSPELQEREDVIRKWNKASGIRQVYPKGQAGLTKAIIVELEKIKETVCEIGCGTGRLSKYFKKNKYIGTDINESAIKEARKTTSHNYKVDEYMHTYQSMESCLLFTVLLHIRDIDIPPFLDTLKEYKTIYIFESMNKDFRRIKHNNNFQRNIKDYEGYFLRIGKKVTDFKWLPVDNFPYFINFLKIEDF